MANIVTDFITNLGRMLPCPGYARAEYSPSKLINQLHAANSMEWSDYNKARLMAHNVMKVAAKSPTSFQLSHMAEDVMWNCNDHIPSVFKNEGFAKNRTDLMSASEFAAWVRKQAPVGSLLAETATAQMKKHWREDSLRKSRRMNIWTHQLVGHKCIISLQFAQRLINQALAPKMRRQALQPAFVGGCRNFAFG